jgi:hypothetical protein
MCVLCGPRRNSFLGICVVTRLHNNRRKMQASDQFHADFAAGKWPPCVYVGGWVGPRAGLDSVGPITEKNIVFRPPGS